MAQRVVEPVWCIVADVVERPAHGPGSTGWQGGLRRFPPGARVYVVDGYAGMGWQAVTVVGDTRPGYATVAVATEHLSNWRVKLVSSPAVLERLGDAGPHPYSGFSPHGHDPRGDAYRDDLRRLATTFRRRTGVLRRQWAARYPLPAGGERDVAGRVPARGLARLRRLVTAGRPRGRSR